MLTTGAAVICVALRDAGCDRLPLGLFPGDRVEADLRCGSSGGEAGWLEECGSIAAEDVGKTDSKWGQGHGQTAQEISENKSQQDVG